MAKPKAKPVNAKLTVDDLPELVDEVSRLEMQAAVCAEKARNQFALYPYTGPISDMAIWARHRISRKLGCEFRIQAHDFRKKAQAVKDKIAVIRDLVGDQPITANVVRAALRESRTRTEIVDILARFGAKSVSELDPKFYTAVIEAAR